MPTAAADAIEANISISEDGQGICCLGMLAGLYKDSSGAVGLSSDVSSFSGGGLGVVE